jgi:hypothetical protein
MTDTNRQWVLANRPEGLIEDTTFELREAAVPTPDDGQFVVRVLYLSFDPTQRGWLNDTRGYVPPVQIGEVMRASAVGRVVASKHSGFAGGRPGGRRLRLAGIRAHRRHRPGAGGEAAARGSAHPRALDLRDHRADRLLRDARRRPPQARRRGAGVGRGGRHRLGGGPDRQAPGLPRDRDRGRAPRSAGGSPRRRGSRRRSTTGRRTSTSVSPSSVRAASTSTSTTLAGRPWTPCSPTWRCGRGW